MMISTVPCRSRLEHKKTVGEFVRFLHEDHITTSKYAYSSIGDIQKMVGISGGNQLFKSAFVYQNIPLESFESSQFELVEVDGARNLFNDYDLQLVLQPKGPHLDIKLEYSAQIAPALADRILMTMSDTLINLIELLCYNPETKLAQLQKISDHEQEMLLKIGQGSKVEIPFLNGHHAFEKCARDEPDLVAVEQGPDSITYGELNQRAEELAAVLISEGLKVGEYVGLVTIRSIEMVIGIMAVLKAGGAYVPIDSTIPLERINYILDTAKCSIVLYHPQVDENVLKSVESAKLLSLVHQPMENPPPRPHSVPVSSPAYVVFTSGSTGRPKGVVISHSSFSNFIKTEESYGLAKGSRLSQFSSIMFDTCVASVFCCLSRSATLVLRDEDDFFRAIRNSDSTSVIPSVLAKMNPLDFPSLKTVVTGGEACSKSVVEKWTPYVTFINSYGPSEITVASTCGEQNQTKPVSIGKPMANTHHYIVDKNLELVPFGVVGELIIGGAGVSLGYLNRPDLTAERFLPNHFLNDGSKMYRTGDLCRWTEDGELQIMGRMDDMVKVKGYRIELDEVSAAITRHPDITNATVIVKDDVLVAFFSPAQIPVSSLRDFVGDILPHYMIPATFVALDDFPLNTNGKVFY